jgi:hypothetical protein
MQFAIIEFVRVAAMPAFLAQPHRFMQVVP